MLETLRQQPTQPVEVSEAEDEQLSSGWSDDSSDAEAGPADQDEDDLPFEAIEQRRQDGFARRPSTSQPASARGGRAAADTQAGTRAAAGGGTGRGGGGSGGGKGAAAGTGAQQQAGEEEEQSFKRLNKNRPQEMSSKKPVGRFRDVMQAGKHRAVDPRFDALTLPTSAASDKLQSQSRRRYAFVLDEVLPQEKADIKVALNKVKSAAKREELQARLAAVERQMQGERDRRKADERKLRVKAAEKEAVVGGKAPFYQKKSDKRKAELLERYKELKASGQLQSYLAKRRKRNAAKDHRYLPSSRREVADE